MKTWVTLTQEKKSKGDKKAKNHNKYSKTQPIKKGNIKNAKFSREKIKGKDIEKIKGKDIKSTKFSAEKKQSKIENNKNNKDNLSVKTKPSPKEKVNNKVEKQEKKKEVLKSAKEWGQASNDPRRKTN